MAMPRSTPLQEQAASGNQSIALSLVCLRAAQAAVASSRASQSPTLGTSASASRARSGSQAADGSSNTRTSSSYSLGLNASWELDLWGRLAGTVDAAQATAQASRTTWLPPACRCRPAWRKPIFAACGRGQRANAARDAAGLRAQLGADAQPPAGGRGLGGRCGAGRIAIQVHPGAIAGGRNHRTQLENALAALLGQAPPASACPPRARCPAPGGARPAAIATAGAPPRYRRCRAPGGRRQCANRRGPGRIFPSAHAVGHGGYRGSELSNLFNAPTCSGRWGRNWRCRCSMAVPALRLRWNRPAPPTNRPPPPTARRC